MTEKKKNAGGGNQILAGYSWQVFFVFIFASSLFGIFYWLFGVDQDLLWTNIVVLAIWLILLLLSLLIPPIGDFWRVNKWIMGSSVLILLFLFDSSWAQSSLSTSSLERDIVESIPVDTRLYLQAEYPSQILYDGSGKVEIRLLATGSFENLKQRKIIIASSDKILLFAVKPLSDEPIVWSDSLEFDLSENANAITLLAQPAERTRLNTLSANLTWKADGLDLVTPKGNKLRIEGERDSKIRTWKKTFLGTSSLIVALIGTIFAGIKQWDEEDKRKKAAKEDDEKRRKIEEIRSAIDAFDIDIKNGISNALDKSLELLRGWGEWDRPLQNQFIKKVTNFVDSNEFWDGISDKDITKLTIIVGQFLKLYETFQTMPIPKHLNLLNTSTKPDARALLTLLRDYPQSIFIVEKITSGLPEELKKKIPDEYKNEFSRQIIALKNELGFPDSDSFPLQEQFQFFADTPNINESLKAWLEKHQMGFSPFLDKASPYTYTPHPKDRKFFIEQVSTGFTFPDLERPSENLEFSSSWDANAALFAYLRGLSSKKQQAIFVVLLTPTMITDFSIEQPRELFLHALAEQWLWILAETPTLYYSLKEMQRSSLGRLLCWHSGSPYAALRSLEQILGNKKEEQSTINLLKKMTEWLKVLDATSLRREEMNNLIELRPVPNQTTLLLVSSVGWRQQIGGEITPDVHKQIDEKAEWLQAHDWTRIHFLISSTDHQKVPLPNLAKQCQQRIIICSNGKVEALEVLFSPHTEDPADFILARKANGSPSEMVRLGQKLLLQHAEKYSSDEDLHIEDLIALE